MTGTTRYFGKSGVIGTTWPGVEYAITWPSPYPYFDSVRARQFAADILAACDWVDAQKRKHEEEAKGNG